MSVAIRIFQERYTVFYEPVNDKPYYVRFKHLQTGKTIQGMTHAKGTKLSPIFIIQILERFDIDRADFIEAIPSVKKGAISVR